VDAPTRMGLDDWKAKAQAGEAPPSALLRKQYVPDIVRAAAGDSRKIDFTISTGAVDRDRDTLKVEGWRLDNYRKNPVVLWAHLSRELPIGRAESVGISAGVLKARTEFVPAEDYPFADTVYRMLRGGFLRSVSVGFIPDFEKAVFVPTRGGFDFGGQELLEFSVVPVPSNPEALVDAKAAGIDVGPVTSWCERFLAQAEPGSILVSRQTVEAGLKALAAPRIVVPDIEKALDFALAIGKRGRVLSAANEERLRNARSSGGDLCAALDDVLAQVAAEEAQAAAAPVPKAEEPFLMVLVDPAPAAPAVPAVPAEPVEPTYLVDPKELEAVITASVRDTVHAEIRRAAGRLD